MKPLKLDADSSRTGKLEDMNAPWSLSLIHISSLAASKNLHIRVTAQLKLLPKLGQMLLLLTTDIIWLVFCIIVVNVGTDFIISMSDRPMVSGALMLDMRYVYAAVPIAFTLQAVRLVERWWRIFTKRDPLVVPSEEVF